MDFEKMMKENNAFVGTVMDEEKDITLSRMRDLCDRLCAMEKRVTCAFSPVVNTRRHADVKLLLPLPVFLPSAAFNKTLGELISLSDDVTFANIPGEPGKLTIACNVLNIWKEVETVDYKTNAVKNTWDVYCHLERDERFTYHFEVEAKSLDAARLLAAAEIPEGYRIDSLTPLYDVFQGK